MAQRNISEGTQRLARGVITTAACLVLALTPLARAEDPCLENGLLRLEFDPATGCLASLEDLQNGHEFLEDGAAGDLWQINLLPPHADSGIAASGAGNFQWTFPEDAAGAVELLWDGFARPDAPGLQVRAKVWLSKEEPTAFWTMTVSGIGDLRLAAVRFPRVTRIAEQEDEILAAPIWMGQKMAGPRRFLCRNKGPARMEWECPGRLSLQCMALYQQDGPGLFVASRDTKALAKRFAAFGEPGGGAGLEAVHLPESQSGGRYEMPYTAVTGAFRGDWFTVAERYRRWGLEQPWAAAGRLNSGAVADWVEETGLWVWNRGRSANVLEPALALRQQADIPVSVFWHWWHGCPYDVGFPEYLPPREGAEPFRDAVRKASESGVHAIVYMNQRLWGMTTDSWEEKGAEQYAVKGPDGTVRPEVYNTFTKSPCASMCMGTAFWRDTYAALAEEAVVDLGVAGIYMDQACSSLACYDPTHGHPLGGGAYWMEGFRTLQADIRERTSPARRVVLAGEGCGEAWLPYLDLMLSLQVSMERYASPGAWEPIPFFHAVYHGHAVFFGNYSSLTMPPYDTLWPAEFAPKEPLKLLDRRFAHQFRMEQARAFVWGQQPSLANFRPAHLEQRREEMDYVVRLAKLFMRARKYLLHGTMLRPPETGVPEHEVDISRLSIYAGQQGALTQYRKDCPAVLASAWQAPGGGVCVVVANISDGHQAFSLALDRDDYPLPAQCGAAIIGPEITTPIDISGGDTVNISVDLAPAEARIYAFSRE